MVAFHNLDVRAGAQNGGSLLDQLQQDVDAQGHIGAAEDRNGLSGLVDLRQLLRTEAGGGDDDGDAALHAEGEQVIQRLGVGEVDDHVCLAGEVGGVGVNGIVQIVLMGGEARHDGHVRVSGAYGLDDLTHFTGTAGIDYL